LSHLPSHIYGGRIVEQVPKEQPQCEPIARDGIDTGIDRDVQLESLMIQACFEILLNVVEDGRDFDGLKRIRVADVGNPCVREEVVNEAG